MQRPVEWWQLRSAVGGRCTMWNDAVFGRGFFVHLQLPAMPPLMALFRMLSNACACTWLLACMHLYVVFRSQLSAMGAIESRLSLIDELNAELGSLAEQYGAARDELAAVRLQYDESRQQLATATAEYDTVRQQLAAVQAKYDEAITREQEQVGHRGLRGERINAAAPCPPSETRQRRGRAVRGGAACVTRVY